MLCGLSCGRVGLGRFLAWLLPLAALLLLVVVARTWLAYFGGPGGGGVGMCGELENETTGTDGGMHGLQGISPIAVWRYSGRILAAPPKQWQDNESRERVRAFHLLACFPGDPRVRADPRVRLGQRLQPGLHSGQLPWGVGAISYCCFPGLKRATPGCGTPALHVAAACTAHDTGCRCRFSCV